MARKQRKTQPFMCNSLLQHANFETLEFLPKTERQQQTFEYYQEGSNLLLYGSAGTGKTFISFYLAMQDILNYQSQYEKLVIVRSIVPTRDIGFLPGTEKQKMQIYEMPYTAIANEVFGRGDAYEILKQKHFLDFISTSFIRGITLQNTIILVDECQNMSFHELDSIITRLGEHCKIIFCGDFKQSDLKEHEKTGLIQFLKIIKNMTCFKTIEFHQNDIVRSNLVKQYIVQKEHLGIYA